MTLRFVPSILGCYLYLECLCVPLLAAPVLPSTPEVSNARWRAIWVSAADMPAFDYGVQHFRKTFHLNAVPGQFFVDVSADNRYELFVNGKCVGRGPARGDLNHWRFNRLDLISFLHQGENVLAAQVWNFGEYAAENQVTWRSGFILRAENPALDDLVRTDTSWKALRNRAYSPLVFSSAEMLGYYAAGPGDRVDGALYPWNWESSDYDEKSWPSALPAVGDGRAAGCPRGLSDGCNRWMLEPSPIPQMVIAPQHFSAVRDASGVVVPDGFLQGLHPLNIPPHCQARVWLDQGSLTTAYPELVLNGGKGAEVSLGYAEALYGADGQKGNRDEVAGHKFVGNRDVFLSDGGQGRHFRPLWWRAFRYVELKVNTGETALQIADLHSEFTAYPFERQATFVGGDAQLQKILEVGWHTARLCAHETYMDCPYYEQLQYVGDTRIQALVSYTTTGDARLARNAIELIDASRISDGFTMSRAPTRQQQLIPPFSLWWIGMVHDYWRYVDDPAFCRDHLPGVRSVLDGFAASTQSDGTLQPMAWWNYIDWVSGWPHGRPKPSSDGSCSILDLQLLLALQWAAELERQLGSAVLADKDHADALRLANAIQARYWDKDKKLFADSTAKNTFSQHANALAVIAGVVDGTAATDLMSRVIEDQSLAPCSLYFKHYLHEAALRAGLGDRYLGLLGSWNHMLALGLTTFAEQEGRTRSDCHAWSASPNFEVFRTVLGVEPSAPGYVSVSVRPHPGKLLKASGRIPHPHGWLEVQWNRLGEKGMTATVNLPERVDGVFYWQGQNRRLQSGHNEMSF